MGGVEHDDETGSPDLSGMSDNTLKAVVPADAPIETDVDRLVAAVHAVLVDGGLRVARENGGDARQLESDWLATRPDYVVAYEKGPLKASLREGTRIVRVQLGEGEVDLDVDVFVKGEEKKVQWTRLEMVVERQLSKRLEALEAKHGSGRGGMMIGGEHPPQHHHHHHHHHEGMGGMPRFGGLGAGDMMPGGMMGPGMPGMQGGGSQMGPGHPGFRPGNGMDAPPFAAPQPRFDPFLADPDADHMRPPF